MADIDSSCAKIKTINRQSASDQVYRQMKHLIDTRAWPPGYKIPSENELAKQFGVSRMTIRAATQRLKAFGLLSIRSGSGSYVEAQTLDSYMGLDSLKTYPEIQKEVYEIRYYLEEAAFELAIVNCTEDDLVEFKMILNNLIEAAKDDPQNFRKYDLDFHRYINIMSGNQLLLTMFNITESLFASQMDKYDSSIPEDELMVGRIRFHTNLFNAIANHDVQSGLKQIYWYRGVSEAKDYFPEIE